MLTDDGDERARPDPRVCGRRGIEIVDRTAGWVDSIERVARSAGMASSGWVQKCRMPVRLRATSEKKPEPSSSD